MKALVYTVAQNGYNFAWQKCVDSHARYAKRLGAAHVVVTQPAKVSSPALSAWLKVPLMLEGLRAGYDWVIYIDADCEVKADAPDFRVALGDSPDPIMMALGRSGRINSGVIISRRDPSAIGFWEAVMASLSESIPAADRANLKYENGNIIYVSNKRGGVAILDPKWNNTFDPELDDYIRHYTGPLRELYKRSVTEQVKVFVNRMLSPKPSSQPESRDQEFIDELSRMVSTVTTAYPALVRQVS